MRAEPGHGGQVGQALVRCGIGLDAEQVARFEKFAAGAVPWRFVYSEREAAHLAAQPQVARAFCAAFCCKEALCKALGGAYSFPKFECLYQAGVAEPRIVLAPGFEEIAGGADLRVRIDEQYFDERGEIVAEVSLSRTAGSRRESLRVAAVEAERERIVAEHFSPGELADLGKRRVQSLAGSLALKRALVGLWVDAGTAAAPRDFELGHLESGAPRLVAAPGGVALADIFVSISHTRQWAYGLAAIGKGGQSAEVGPV